MGKNNNKMKITRNKKKKNQGSRSERAKYDPHAGLNEKS